jgi:carbonic anhydrase
MKEAYHANRISLEQSVHDDVKLLRETKVIRRELRERTKGYLYDVKTGLVRRV